MNYMLSPANIRHCSVICKVCVRKLRGVHFPNCAVSFSIPRGFISRTARSRFPNRAVSSQKPRGFVSKTARFRLQNCAVSSPKLRGFIFQTARFRFRYRGAPLRMVRKFCGIRPWWQVPESVGLHCMVRDLRPRLSALRASGGRSCPAGGAGLRGQSVPGVRARTGGGASGDGGW